MMLHGTGFPPKVRALFVMQLNDTLKGHVPPYLPTLAETVVPSTDDAIAIVSHELRTPLSAIRGCLSLLSTGAAGSMSEQARDLIEVAERNAIRLIELVDNLLEKERMTSGQFAVRMTPTNTTTLIDSAVDSVTLLAEQYSIKLKLPQHHFKIFADGSRLVQVLINLLSNAIKFSPRGSTITVQTLRHKSNIEFRITDAGPGISENWQKLLFQRFVQINEGEKPRMKGTGIGLWICRRIVEAHNGTIGVKSTPGNGSTFWFSIPAPSSSGSPAEQPAAMLKPRRERAHFKSPDHVF